MASGETEAPHPEQWMTRASIRVWVEVAAGPDSGEAEAVDQSEVGAVGWSVMEVAD